MASCLSEVESGYSLIVQDLQKMHHLVLDQAAALGAPAISRNETTSSAWDKINQVQQSVASVASSIQAQAATLEHLSEEQNNLTQSVIALESTAEDHHYLIRLLALLLIFVPWKIGFYASCRLFLSSNEELFLGLPQHHWMVAG
jgi:hypothetical protein